MSHAMRCLVAALPLWFAACAPSGGDSSAPGAPDLPTEPAVEQRQETAVLEGSAWQLVEIRSMDDTAFTPDDRAKYTLAFEPDGRVTVRADCNRGQGGYTREGESGLQFGPLATTRALCPPDSLHDRYLADLGYVRSFVMREGRLYLATMADGAILEFEPLPPR